MGQFIVQEMVVQYMNLHFSWTVQNECALYMNNENELRYLQIAEYITCEKLLFIDSG